MPERVALRTESLVNPVSGTETVRPEIGRGGKGVGWKTLSEPDLPPDSPPSYLPSPMGKDGDR